MMKAALNFLRRLMHQQDGNIAGLLGVSVIPLVLAGGTATDMAQAYAVKVTLGAALDAAALAVGSSDPTKLNAAQLNTIDVDASCNLAFVNSQMNLIAQLCEVMLRTKMEADDAVRRAEFHRALEIMSELGQNKIAAKQFQDYVKKLKDIDAIATPNQK